jgi:hypothetical protein
MSTTSDRAVVRVNELFDRKHRPGLLPVSKGCFYTNFALQDPSDKFVPGTNGRVRRLRLLRISQTMSVAFRDEVETLIEELRKFRDSTDYTVRKTPRFPKGDATAEAPQAA